MSDLTSLPVPARKLLSVIARQAYHGTLRSKEPGVATMPEVHEACGLDVDQMDSLIQILKHAGFITVEGDYPFEELKPTIGTLLAQCEAAGIQIEDVVVDLRPLPEGVSEPRP